ncbi:sirtuin [Leucogyrophana mollusca]|uniref:Sirtuin n=1 Tax=Leucogyrophana mollusca TaxID=85980 RepID=A0ACB8B844_9AGAM|nr:sirtuin [Leucogyrophana mollusca]
MAPSSDPQAFRAAIKSAKTVIILAGAGLSAGSGIPTYRGADGLWIKQDPKKLATPEGFKADASAIWQFYHSRRDTCLQAQPNAAHTFLASLSIPSVCERLLPSLSDNEKPPLFITQNFDSLSTRALEALHEEGKLSDEEIKIAKERLIEMHGSVFRTICTDCKHVKFTYDTPLCPALASTEEEGGDVEDVKKIPLAELPRCGGTSWNGRSNRYGSCGGLLRPGVVWFGEVPEGLGEIARKLNWAELLIVVGTSSLVHPAASFQKTVRDRRGKVAVFNLNRSEGDDLADFLFLGPCEETLVDIFQAEVGVSSNVH